MTAAFSRNTNEISTSWWSCIRAFPSLWLHVVFPGAGCRTPTRLCWPTISPTWQSWWSWCPRASWCSSWSTGRSAPGTNGGRTAWLFSASGASAASSGRLGVWPSWTLGSSLTSSSSSPASSTLSKVRVRGAPRQVSRSWWFSPHFQRLCGRRREYWDDPKGRKRLEISHELRMCVMLSSSYHHRLHRTIYSRVCWLLAQILVSVSRVSGPLYQRGNETMAVVNHGLLFLGPIRREAASPLLQGASPETY